MIRTNVTNEQRERARYAEMVNAQKRDACDRYITDRLMQRELAAIRAEHVR